MFALVPETVRRPIKQGLLWGRHAFGFYQSESQIAADAQRFWTSDHQARSPGDYHERGAGPFVDDAAWQDLGRGHFDLFEGFARQCNFARPMQRILEWGCGGGANAVHFARDTHEFIGVDLSAEILKECAAQLHREGFDRFVPVEVDVSDIAPVVQRFTGSCDLFLCTYVYELLPSRAHGLRLLAAAHDMLRKGGMAFIQIKYDTGELRTRARPWDYARHMSQNTTYRIDEFWIEAIRLGFSPCGVHLVPRPKAIDDERYAYFALIKV